MVYPIVAILDFSGQYQFLRKLVQKCGSCYCFLSFLLVPFCLIRQMSFIGLSYLEGAILSSCLQYVFSIWNGYCNVAPGDILWLVASVPYSLMDEYLVLNCPT